MFASATSTTELYTLSLHDALPICAGTSTCRTRKARSSPAPGGARRPGADRKSTRLNSSHRTISYAVFCLKKKKKHQQPRLDQPCEYQRRPTRGIAHEDLPHLHTKQ